MSRANGEAPGRVASAPRAGKHTGRRHGSAPAAILALIALGFMLPHPALARPLHRPAACAGAHASARSASARRLRAAVVCLINSERARHHLRALRPVSTLTASAQGYTTEMVDERFFGSTGPNGSTPGARMAAAGFQWSAEAENVARGYATPASVVSAWMRSESPCYTILAPVFADVGVGVSARSDGATAGPGTWTADLALASGARAPSGNWGPANRCP